LAISTDRRQSAQGSTINFDLNSPESNLLGQVSDRLFAKIEKAPSTNSPPSSVASASEPSLDFANKQSDHPFG
jgi:hypothetical protein